jgi:hypothetical protein
MYTAGAGAIKRVSLVVNPLCLELTSYPPERRSPIRLSIWSIFARFGLTDVVRRMATVDYRIGPSNIILKNYSFQDRALCLRNWNRDCLVSAWHGFQVHKIFCIENASTVGSMTLVWLPRNQLTQKNFETSFGVEIRADVQDSFFTLHTLTENFEVKRSFRIILRKFVL